MLLYNIVMEGSAGRQEGQALTDKQLFFEYKGVRKRKIYLKVDYSQQEKEWIAMVRQELSKTDIKIAEDDILLRFYYSSECNMPYCLDKLAGYNQWYSDPNIQAFSQQTRRVLSEGYIYCGGRARDGRPFIVMDLGVFDVERHSGDSYMQAINHVINHTIREELVPGRLETYYFVVDLNEQLLSLPLSSLGKIIKQITNVYSLRLERFFVLNVTTVAKWIYNRVSAFLSEDTLRKISLSTRDELLQNRVLSEIIDDEVLEVKFGGKRQNLDHAALHAREEERPAANNQSRSEWARETEYFSIEENEDYFYYEQGCCGKGECAIC